MSLKLQYVKCIFCVILYLLICFLFLRLKANLHLTKHVYTERNNETKQRDSLSVTKEIDPSTTIAYNEKPVNLNVHLLYHKLKHKSSYQQENKSLLKQVSNTCLKYDLNIPLKIRNFSYSPKHKSLYCWIRKVASTTFTTLFSNMEDQRNINSLAPHSLEQLQQLINDSNIFKLLIIRHPFERLVSSYRDRIEDNTKYTAQAWIYTQRIYHLTRPNLFYSNTTTGNSLERIFTRDRRLKIVPTFKEFIEWLLQESPEHDDVHWNRYYTHCGVYESTMYLPNLKPSKGGCTNFKLTCKYFRHLTDDTILKLYARYKIDFEMYNYELDKYLQLTNTKITMIFYDKNEN